jgi:hypothetical protein
MSIGVDNLLRLFDQADEHDYWDGFTYYDRQRSNLESFAEVSGIWAHQIIGAFAALSPNVDESGNYRALASCIAIFLGRLPQSAPVIGYGPNKAKALAILRGGNVLDILRGQKVTAFYHNTLNPDDPDAPVTIDGHMYGAWLSRRVSLKRFADIKPATYLVIANDFRTASKRAQLPTARFQSILWLTWKRLNNILYNAQLKFESGYSPERAKWIIDHAPLYRTSYLPKAGEFAPKVTCAGTAAQLSMEFEEANALTESFSRDFPGIHLIQKSKFITRTTTSSTTVRTTL